MVRTDARTKYGRTVLRTDYNSKASQYGTTPASSAKQTSSQRYYFWLLSCLTRGTAQLIYSSGAAYISASVYIFLDSRDRQT